MKIKHNCPAMQQLTTNPQFKDKWDVFINLSADSMPVYTPRTLSQYFHGPLHNVNFVTSSSCATGLLPTNINLFPTHWHKSGHYKEKGDFEVFDFDNGGNVTLTIHFGSQWMALTPSFVKYIATSMNDENSVPSQFKRQLIDKERLMADETFIPTLLVHNLNFSETLPNILDDGTLESMKGMSAIR